ncbi:transposase [Elysia marginata]|uniref:Transposase n=1 Tax=Elysia marginata TaxID=1093978 RepID=A0AAV4FKF5_9GAST|nr:transposase [Elysia marginata]
MIRANQRVKLKDIADEVGISKERVYHIVTTLLSYRKVSARWVLRQFTVEMRAQSPQLLERYSEGGKAFLQRILTGGEFWVHQYDPECKSHWHKTCPSPRKFKVVASTRKVLFTVFYNMEGVVHMGFLEQGQTENSERYFSFSTLRALKLDSDVFGVIRTQSCNMTMRTRTPVAKLRTP